MTPHPKPPKREKKRTRMKRSTGIGSFVKGRNEVVLGHLGRLPDGEYNYSVSTGEAGTAEMKDGVLTRTPMRRGKKRKRMRARSKKTEAKYAGPDGRTAFVARVLAERPPCEACPIITARSFSCSAGVIRDIHEIKPRSAGGSILEERNVLAVCRAAHLWIHSHPREAKRLGLLRGRYDDPIAAG